MKVSKTTTSVALISILFGTLFLGTWWVALGAPGQSPPNGNPVPPTGYFTLSGSNLYASSTSYNLSIGTTTPASKLHINSSDGDTRITLSGPGSLNGGLQLFMIDSGQRAGLYHKENGPLEFYTNATERMRISSAGNVGIATTTPAEKLTVVGNIKIASSTAGLIFGDGTTQTTAGASVIGAANVSSDVFGRLQGSGNFAFPAGLGIGTSTTAGMPTNGLYVNGSVGIGTAAPLRNLSIYAASSPTFQIINSATGITASDGLMMQQSGLVSYIGNQETGDLQLFVDNGTGTRIIQLQTGTGNVGIGTATPRAALEVWGSNWESAPYYGTILINDKAAMAAGVGGSVMLQGKSNTGNDAVDEAGLIKAYKDNATTGDYGYRLGLSSRPNGGPLTERLSISSGGNIGIGTTAPNNKLEIKGSGATSIRVTNEGVYPWDFGVSTDAKFHLLDGNTGVVQGAFVFAPYSELTLGVTAQTGTGSLYSGNGYFSGNVGIGTTAPSSTLHVIGTSTIAGNVKITGANNGIIFPDATIQTTAASGTGSGVISAANVSSDVFGRLQGNGNFAFPAGLGIGTSTTAGMPTNGLYVNGSVGIGTASPGGLLNVVKDGGANGVFFDSYGSSIQFRMRKWDGTVASPTAVQSGDEIGYSPWIQGYDGSTLKTIGYILYSAAETFSGTQLGTRVRFTAVPGGQNKTVVENFMEYTTTGNLALQQTSGNVGIGTTAPAAQLTVNGLGQSAATFDTAGALGGSLLLSDSGTGVGNGGALVFGAASQAWKFGAIKGLIQDGTNNTLGDIGIFTRKINTDATLSQVVTIKSSGNVGIGTSTPAYNLDVFSSGNGAIRINAANASRFFMNSASNSFSLQNNYNVAGAFGVHNDTTNADPLIILNNGNVGIGTPSPGYKLDVSGAGGAAGQVRIINSNNGFLTFATDASDNSLVVFGANGVNKNLDFQRTSTLGANSGTSVLFLKSDGNVGIGTSTPAYKLDVNGDMNLAAGSVYRIGGVTQSGSSKWTAGTGDNIYRSSGYISIGTSTTPAYDVEVYNSSTAVIMKLTSATAGSWIILKPGNSAGQKTWQAGANLYGYSIYDAASSTYRFTVSEAGNVGIGMGTTAPSALLDVGGAGRIRALSGTATGPSTGKGVEIGYASSTELGFVVAYDRDNGGVWKDLSIQGDNIRFYNGGAEKVRIASSGFVGIGTNNPQAKFMVYAPAGSSTIWTRFMGGNDGADIFNTGDNSPFSIQSMGDFGASQWVSSITLNPYGGNVGIGTTTAPAAKLDVAGQVIAAGPGGVSSFVACYGGGNTYNIGNTGCGYAIKDSAGTAIPFIAKAAGDALNFGTNDNTRLRFIANGNLAGVLSAAGNWNLGPTEQDATVKLNVEGTIRIASSTAGLIFGDGTTQTTAASGSGLIRAGGNTTEATTVSLTSVDLLTASGLSIPANAHILVLADVRKTAGAAANVQFGLKLNSTQVILNQGYLESDTSRADTGLLKAYVGARVTNYLGNAWMEIDSAQDGVIARRTTEGTDSPTGTITSVTITALTNNSAVTAAADELQVYYYATQ
ncbi:MAG: hypothetical protein ABSE68_00180 [Minisyncoccia bacterium]